MQNAEAPEWTLDEVLEVAPPFSLLNVISGYIVWSDIPGDFVKLLHSVSQLVVSYASVP